jgi:hypothetical protein
MWLLVFLLFHLRLAVWWRNSLISTCIETTLLLNLVPGGGIEVPAGRNGDFAEGKGRG